LDFVLIGLAPEAATTISITTINALGDGLGIALPVDRTADALVRRTARAVPAPGALVLIMSGIAALRLIRRRVAESSAIGKIPTEPAGNGLHR
jgi:shikimate kinase